jgi:hypothetical protein
MPNTPPQTLERGAHVSRQPSKISAWVAIVAAAFVVGLFPWTLLMTHRAGAAASSQPAIDALLADGFAQAPLAAQRPDAPAAKVLYARDGGWLYVLVAAGQTPLDVAATSGGKSANVATIAASGSARAAFVTLSGRADAVSLLDHGVPIATARLAAP